jgi:hypothetical protein
LASAGARPPKGPAPEDLWDDKVKWPGTLEEQNAHLLDVIAYHHDLSKLQRDKLEAVFAASEVLGQGNPRVAKHAMSVAECREIQRKAELSFDDPSRERICRGKYMAPLYDPDTTKQHDASTCIDRFEFPDIPCTYPLTWVRADEAVALCQAMGKRLCDAHEWEGACAGKLEPPDYDFGTIDRLKEVEKARKAMRFVHNRDIDRDTDKGKQWAYGSEYEKGICATGSRKSKDCGIGWNKCGTNTYPSGSFPQCVSKLGVYDQHGNAAEHMNLPLKPDQMASSPEQHYGQTEMKGSWFIFDSLYAHDDHCRWRAPDWHGTRVMNPKSHRNYHLGFRCCKTVKPK